MAPGGSVRHYLAGPQVIWPLLYHLPSIMGEKTFFDKFLKEDKESCNFTGPLCN